MRNKLALMIIIMVVVSFFGCSEKENSSTEMASSKVAQEETKSVTLSWLIWDKNQQAGMEAIAAAFTEKNPHITIKVNVTGWGEYWTKLEAAATGGALPDIFWMHIAEFYKYAEHNMLLDLTNELSASIFDPFPQDLVDLYTVEGRRYGVPKDFDTIGVFYNKELFDKAGVPYPQGSWDWDEYTETAKKLTSNDVWGTAAPLDPQSGYWNAIYQNGGYVISEDKKTSGMDDPKTIEALEWYVGLSLDENVSPPHVLMEENGVFEMFVAEKLAMVMLGSWMIPGLTQTPQLLEKLGVVALPSQEQGASIYNGLAYSASSQTKHKKEALAFLEFLASKEANLIQAEYASAIPAYRGTSESWVNHIPNLDLQIFVDQLDVGIIYPTSKYGLQWDLLRNDIFPPVFTGNVDVRTASEEYANKMNAILASE